MDDKPKKLRGFAALTPERRKEVAAMGGASIPPDQRAFFKNRDLASNAGRAGGLVKKAGE